MLVFTFFNTSRQRLKPVEYVITARGCHEIISHISRNSGGYPRIFYEGRSQNVSRVVWEHYKGRIPRGLLVLHTCDNPACVNIKHLFLGTHKDNTQDMISKGRFKSNFIGIDNHGENNGRAKLTYAKVRQIRFFLERGLSPKRIEKLYHVSRVVIGQVKTRKTWNYESL
jgi:hypothetical protein